MKNRLEYKYLVPLSYMDKLRADLLKYLEPDEYAAVRPGHEYTVRSVYLDSHDYKCYYEKLDGIHTRKKFRIRGYNRCENYPRVYFEIKRKHDNFISKSRAGTSFVAMQTVLMDSPVESYFTMDEKNDFDYFYYYYQLKRLEPKVLIVYDREPFECKFGSKLRITFDKYLRSKVVSDARQLFEENGLRTIYQREFIFEVKFFQVLPQWINQTLEKYDLTRLAVSKYTSSIVAQNSSSIRINKFNRNMDFQRSGV
jgi:hypothetical protein